MSWTEASVIARVAQELQDTGTAIWGTAEIRQAMDDALVTISEYIPRLAKGTVSFASTARELSLSSLTDLMDVDSVEFPIDEHPKRYVNFTKRGGTVILDDYLPSVETTDSAYIWYFIPHEVSGTATNTLSPREQPILVELCAGNVAISKASKFYAQVNSALTDILSSSTAISNMNTLLTNAATALVLEKTEVDKMQALILSAGTAIAAVDAKVLSSGTAIASATALINTITVDDTPQTDWLNVASGNLGLATGYLNEANGYITQANSDSAVGNAYGSLAMRDLNLAAQHLNQAGGYLRKTASQLSITSAGRYLEDWGLRKVANATRKLAGMAEINPAIRYPDVK
jgi:hypothetical protein